MNAQPVQHDINQIKRLIKKKYPDAVFRVVRNPENEERTMWLDVYTDQASLSDITDLVIQRQIDLLVKKDYLVSVVPQPLRYLPNSSNPKKNISSRAVREKKTNYRAQRKRTRVKV